MPPINKYFKPLFYIFLSSSLFITTIYGQEPLKNFPPPLLNPSPLTFKEQQLYSFIQQAALKKGYHFKFDERLTSLARELLPYLPQEPTQKLNLLFIKARALAYGLTEGQFASLTLRIPKNKAPLETYLAQELALTLKHHIDLNRLGLAFKEDDDYLNLLVLFTHKMLHLKPLPLTAKPDTLLEVRGQILKGQKITKGTLIARFPDQQLKRTPLKIQRGSFQQSLQVGKQPGLLVLEILLEDQTGPQIASLLQINVGTEPLATNLPPFYLPTAPLPAADLQANLETLYSLIATARAQAKLPPLTRAPVLQQLATLYAEELQRGQRLVHISKHSGALSDRLKRAEVRYTRALENIAIGEHAQDIFNSFVGSPAHQANLLDKLVKQVGSGLSYDQETKQFYAVVILID